MMGHWSGSAPTPDDTPCRRPIADPRTSVEVRRGVQELRAILDAVRLLEEIRAVQQLLVGTADSPAPGASETYLADNRYRFGVDKGSCGLGGRSVNQTGNTGGEAKLDVWEHSPVRQYGFVFRLPRYTLRLSKATGFAVGHCQVACLVPYYARETGRRIALASPEPWRSLFWRLNFRTGASSPA
jgi:hypothetical protein